MTNGRDHILKVHANQLTIPAGESVDIPMSLKNLTALNMFLRSTYAATHAVTSGLAVSTQYGSDDPMDDLALVFADNSDPVPVPAPTLGSATPQTGIFEWNVPVLDLPKHLNVHLENTDVTNDCVIDLWSDRL